MPYTKPVIIEPYYDKPEWITNDITRGLSRWDVVHTETLSEIGENYKPLKTNNMTILLTGRNVEK